MPYSFAFVVRNRVMKNISGSKQNKLSTAPQEIVVILADVMWPLLELSLSSRFTKLETHLSKTEWFPGTQDFEWQHQEHPRQTGLS